MSSPTFSPDGQWMWNGTEWIPAPPQSNVLPESSINQEQVSSVANQTGVNPNQLAQAAPYFDQNQDGVLQQSELQQAAMAISQSPTAPVPMQNPQPVMQQPAMQQPVMQQPAMQQPAMQQPAMQQPAMLAPESGKNKKMIFAGILTIVLLTVVFLVWKANLGGERVELESNEIHGTWTFCEGNCVAEAGDSIYNVTFAKDGDLSHPQWPVPGYQSTSWSIDGVKIEWTIVYNSTVEFQYVGEYEIKNDVLYIAFDTINQNNSGVVSETETALMGFVAVREEPIIASGYDIATFSQIIEDNKPTPEWFLEYLGMADLADEQES